MTTWNGIAYLKKKRGKSTNRNNRHETERERERKEGLVVELLSQMWSRNFLGWCQLWTSVVRRKMTSARSENDDSSCNLDVVGGKLVEHRCFRSLELISTGEIPE